MAAATTTYTYSKSTAFTVFMLLFLTDIIPQSISSKSNNRCIERSSFACSGNDDFYVRFPFRLAQDDPSCGFSPAFTLTCTPNGTHLHLSNARSLIPVESINFLEQIVYMDYRNCFEQDLFDSSFSLSGSPFAFNKSDSYTYYNCTPSEYVKDYSVECMNRENYMVVVMKTSYGISPEFNCSAMRTLTGPVGRYGLMSFIGLRWYEPDCVACEAQVGECSFESHCSSEIVCHVSAGQGLFDNVKQRGMWIVLLSCLLLFSMLILGS